MNMIYKITGMLFGLFFFMTAQATPSIVIYDAHLYQYPSVQSSILANIKSATQVTTLKRSGGWKLIKTEDPKPITAWIRSYQVRQGAIAIEKKANSNTSFFSSLASLSKKASGLFSSQKKDYSFQSTATIGVRGLSEEEIKNARPDLKQLKQFKKYRSSKKTTLAYAKKGKLFAIPLPHLKKSKAEK